MKKLNYFMGCVVSSMLIVGCGDSSSPLNENGSIAQHQGATVNLSLKVPTSRNRAYVSTNQIQSILLDVSSSSTVYMENSPFTKNGSNWEIDIPSLPMGETLTFVAKAYDGSSVLIYEATTDVILQDGENNIVLELKAVEESVDREVPSIDNISIIKNVDETIVSFSIENSAQDELEYVIASDTDKGSFNPDRGTLAFSSSRYVLDVDYTQPSEPDTYSNTITLTNSNEDRFITTFDIIANDTNNTTVVLNMPPNIDSIDVNSKDTELILTANISDDNEDSNITYLWEIAEGDVTIDSGETSNPVTITGYGSEPIKVRLTVTDSLGASSSVNYNFNGTYTQNSDEGVVLFMSYNENGDNLYKINKGDKNATLIKIINEDGKKYSNNIVFMDNNNTQVSPKIGTNHLMFLDDGIHGTELWKSDGTAEGTDIVKDIRGGSASGMITDYSNNIREDYYILNDNIYFFANDGYNGQELWKSDGTSTGTSMVKNIDNNSSSAVGTDNEWGDRYGRLTLLGNTLYFQAEDSKGKALWKSDGTEDGTIMVKTISKRFYDLTPVGNQLFFRVEDYKNGYELWKSDGTSEGTIPVDVNISSPSDLENVNGVLYFSAESSENGRELWRSDGTKDGTKMVKDIRLGSNGSMSSWDNNIVSFINNQVLFSADDGSNGKELWISDGTDSGTKLLKDINVGSGGSRIYNEFTAINDKAFFRAYDGSSSNLWVTNGTESGTKSLGINASLYNVHTKTGTLYFTKDRNQLWTSDGSEDGTVMLFSR